MYAEYWAGGMITMVSHTRAVQIMLSKGDQVFAWYYRKEYSIRKPVLKETNYDDHLAKACDNDVIYREAQSETEYGLNLWINLNLYPNLNHTGQETARVEQNQKEKNSDWNRTREDKDIYLRMTLLKDKIQGIHQNF